MKKTSKWYNPDWPDYYCAKCGELYQLYVDGLCSSCRPRKKINTSQKDQNKKFADEWKKKHLKRTIKNK